MKLAAIFSVLACGLTAAMWLRVSPVMGDTGLAPAAGLIAGSLLAGLLLDCWNHKAALILGLGLLSGGLWRLTLAPSSHAALAVVSAIVAAGAAIALLASCAVVLSTTVLSHASALAVLNVVLPVGMLSNPVLSAATVSCAAATLATISLVFAAVTPMPPAIMVRDDSGPAISRLLSLALIFALYGVYEGAVWNWLVTFFGRIRLLDRNDAWQVLSYGVPLGLIVGRIGVSRLLGNVSSAAVLRIAAVVMAFASGLLLLARSPSAAWVAAFCLGVAMSPVLPAALARSYSLLPLHPSLAMALVFTAGSFGLAASIPAVGALSNHFNVPPAMLLLPAVSLLMAALSR